MYDLVYRHIQHIIRFLWCNDVVEDHSDKTCPSSSKKSYQDLQIIKVCRLCYCWSKWLTPIPETSGFASSLRLPIAVLFEQSRRSKRLQPMMIALFFLKGIASMDYFVTVDFNGAMSLLLSMPHLTRLSKSLVSGFPRPFSQTTKPIVWFQRGLC